MIALQSLRTMQASFAKIARNPNDIDTPENFCVDGVRLFKINLLVKKTSLLSKIISKKFKCLVLETFLA